MLIRKLQLIKVKKNNNNHNCIHQSAKTTKKKNWKMTTKFKKINIVSYPKNSKQLWRKFQVLGKFLNLQQSKAQKCSLDSQIMRKRKKKNLKLREFKSNKKSNFVIMQIVWIEVKTINKLKIKTNSKWSKEETSLSKISEISWWKKEKARRKWWNKENGRRKKILRIFARI